MGPISIADLTVGGNRAPVVIAEIGINHNGNIANAKKMIEAARQTGAMLIKLQSFQPESFLKSDLPYYESICRLSFNEAQHEELFAYANDINARLISTAFDAASADFLDRMGVPAFKIASMDCNNIPLLRHVAKKGKPVILATGMAMMDEIAAAVDAVRGAGNDQLILLHCISDYPADPRSMNLEAICTLREKFNVLTGLSDHSEGLHTAIAAVAMGAVLIEKHFTLDRRLAKTFPFSDHAISIQPDELDALAGFCRMFPVIRGGGEKQLTKNELEGRNNYRRGIYAARPLKKGETLSGGMLIPLRPVRGIPVGEWDNVLGKQLKRDITEGEPLTADDIG